MDLFDKIKSISAEVEAHSIESKEALEVYRIKYLGTKGMLKDLMGEIKNISNERKKEFGLVVNELKQKAEDKFATLKEKYESASTSKAVDIDLTAPGYPSSIGTRHPISIVKQQMIDIFGRIGFGVFEGPEIEDDWHNFTALNTPQDHPSRDMQDTFFITEDKNTVLRTHTSSAQIRAMETQTPPIRIITPGRVFRNETISARAHCTFHQVEGLYIDENVSFADLKQTVYYFAKEMFGSENVRFRPSFFPFTEPSAEMDISCFLCDQKGCNICKQTGWVEIGGCGMVDPNVLKNCKIDTERYSGFAFGMGVERVAMLKYQINDLRLFWENDVRFLEQFKSL
jgi:phenylalanyl-tRNA synthetase alpha chain